MRYKFPSSPRYTEVVNSDLRTISRTALPPTGGPPLSYFAMSALLIGVGTRVQALVPIIRKRPASGLWTMRSVAVVGSVATAGAAAEAGSAPEAAGVPLEVQVPCGWA